MYKKFSQTAIVLTVSILLLWLAITYLFPISLPFLLGLGLAFLAEPTVQLLAQKLKLPPIAATGLGVTGVFLLTSGILAILLTLLMQQLTHLTHFFPQLEQGLTQGLTALRQWLTELAPRMPGSIHALIDKWTEDILSDSSTLLQQALSRLPQLAATLVANLSQWIFGIITGVISAYMISLRLPKLRGWIREKLPQRYQGFCLPVVQGFKSALGGWILAECKLAAITFSLLWLGFTLLRIDHSLMLASLITLVDAFPVLGVGTVLVPWGILLLVQGNLPLGLGIFALYGVIWLVRSVLEPKLLGKELGLDPLVTLVCIYAGFRLWGIWGMLLMPILAMGLTQVQKDIRK